MDMTGTSGLPPMNDQDDNAPMTSTPPSANAGGTQTVPLDFLAQPDEQDQMQTPGPGDRSSMNVDFEVVSVSGNMAQIRPLSINGHDLTDPDQNPTPEDADSEELNSLQQEAQGMSAPNDQGAA